MTIGWTMLDRASLDAYMADDWVLKALASRPAGDEELCGNRWLLQQPPKRLVVSLLYGDLLRGGGLRRRVLDVGGGLSSLTRILARDHEYRLIECFAHETPERVDSVLHEMPGVLVGDDWWTFAFDDEYDVIVANDLFPNVDQRLEAFLQRALPRCRNLRLTATIYPHPRFYRVLREDADERMCMLAWDHRLLALVMAPHAERFGSGAAPQWASFGSSLFENGRQIIAFSMRGDL